MCQNPLNTSRCDLYWNDKLCLVRTFVCSFMDYGLMNQLLLVTYILWSHQDRNQYIKSYLLVTKLVPRLKGHINSAVPMFAPK